MGYTRRRLVQKQITKTLPTTWTYFKNYVEWNELKELSGPCQPREGAPELLSENALIQTWGDTQSPTVLAVREVIRQLDDPSKNILTLKQYQIFRNCIVENKSQSLIAKELNISHSAVFKHLALIYKKMRPLILEEIKKLSN